MFIANYSRYVYDYNLIFKGRKVNVRPAICNASNRGVRIDLPEKYGLYNKRLGKLYLDILGINSIGRKSIFIRNSLGNTTCSRLFILSRRGVLEFFEYMYRYSLVCGLLSRRGEYVLGISYKDFLYKDILNIFGYKKSFLIVMGTDSIDTGLFNSIFPSE